MSDGAALHAKWMRRALQLARNGAGRVAPNPMVGAVLVKDDRCLAEGWHRAFGGPHAEVECFAAFGGHRAPEGASLYVNLEPCAHHGKTPPCVDLLIQRGSQRLIVAHGDPNPEVNGRGLEKARAAGIQVDLGVCAEEARWLNRRFLSLHTRRRPYVVLKWARSADGFMDDHGRRASISSPATDVLVHRWRSEEQAILVGGRTVISDDPQLTVRHVQGRSPVRVVIDRARRTAATARVYDGAARTLLVTSTLHGPQPADVITIAPGQDLAEVLHALLHEQLSSAIGLARFGLPPIASILVEGGATVLQAFLGSGLWDEARVITGPRHFGGGTLAPRIAAPAVRTIESAGDRIELYVNGAAPDPVWAW